MRFILRTLGKQAEMERQEAITENPNDYAVIIDGPKVGRIYRHEHGPSKGKWSWFLQSPTGANGYADSLDEAKEELKKRWFSETKKLSPQ